MPMLDQAPHWSATAGRPAAWLEAAPVSSAALAPPYAADPGGPTRDATLLKRMATAVGRAASEASVAAARSLGRGSRAQARGARARQGRVGQGARRVEEGGEGVGEVVGAPVCGVGGVGRGRGVGRNERTGARRLRAARAPPERDRRPAPGQVEPVDDQAAQAARAARDQGGGGREGEEQRAALGARASRGSTRAPPASARPKAGPSVGGT